MGIDLSKRKLKIIGVEEALRLSKAELTGWNILSICGRMEAPLNFRGAKSTKTLHFDDVVDDCPEDGQFSARPEDIQEALEFSRGIDDGPLLIHCQMGISRSTAIAWIIIYDKLKAEPGAVRQSFEFVRKLRPILSPNPHVLRLGIKALAPKGSRKRILQQFQDCLDEINYASPVWVREDVDKNAPTRTTRHPNER